MRTINWGSPDYEANRPDELIRVANLLIKRVPEDKDALLFCGLGYQAQLPPARSTLPIGSMRRRWSGLKVLQLRIV